MAANAAGAGQSGPAIDLVDETLVVAPTARVREFLCDESRWESVLEGLRLSCIDDRGPLGKRWSVTGTMQGSAEVWLEPWVDSVVVHVFLQVDPADGGRVSQRQRRQIGLAIKRHVVEVKDRLDEGRPAGTPLAE